MIRAYIRHADGRSETCEDLNCLHEAWAESGATIWVDLQDESAEQIALLSCLFELNQEPVSECVGGDQRPHLEEFDDWVFLLLYGVLSAGDPPVFRPHKIAIFFTDRVLLTIREADSRTFARVHARVQRKTAVTLERGVDYILFTLIDGLVDNYIACAESYEQRLNLLEDESLDNPMAPDLLQRTADLRQDLLAFRRLIIAMRESLAPLGQGAYEHILERLEERFEHVDHHLKTALEIVDALREVIRGIRENYHAALTERTNQLMKTLTLFATFMLPLSVIVGIFGMNVRTYPSGDNPFAFWIILTVMGTVIVLLYLFLRVRRFL